MMTISSTAGDVMTNLGNGNDESMDGDETPMTSGMDGSDHTYASHGDGTRDYLGDGDNEASDEPNNPGDDAQENNVTNESTLGSGELFYRFLELVHPIWHKTHFKIRWIYISCATTWMFGVIFNFTYDIPTTKVILESSFLLT